MASEKFNTLAGYSVGIPPIEVIDSNGNVISNFNNLSGNVSADRVFANSYFFANGDPILFIRKETFTIGNGIDTEFTITHNFNTRDLTISVYENFGNNLTIFPIIERITENSIRIITETIPNIESINVVIVG
jgi:hypothetical protein